MKAFKRLAVLIGGLSLLAVIALVIVPRLVDLHKFKPELERRIQEASGLPVQLDGDVGLDLLPLTALKLSEVHVANPAGFEGPDFMYIKSLVLRVKPFPLLHGDLQVVSLSLEQPRIIFERNRQGRGNWEGTPGMPNSRRPGYRPDKTGGKSGAHQPSQGLKRFMVERISVAGGTVVYIDQTSGRRLELFDVQLHVKDVSRDRPCQVALSAKVEGKPSPVPVSVKGNVGPLGNEPGKGVIPLELTFLGPEQLELNVKGTMADPAVEPRFDVVARLSPFSPRKALSALGQADYLPPHALDRMAVNTHAAGGVDLVTLSDGTLELDDSLVSFSAVVRRTAGMDVTFAFKLDAVELDRYLLPSVGKDLEARQASGNDEAGEAVKGGGPLLSENETALARASKGNESSLIEQARVNGTVEIAGFKARGIQTRDVRLHISGEKGVYKVDPLNLNLYQGSVSGRATVDVRRDATAGEISLQANGVQVGPLLRDLMKQEPLTGTMQAQAILHMEGIRGERIDRALSGRGDIYVRNGSIRGVSLWSVAKKIEALPGVPQNAGTSPNTDFSEFHFPFTLSGARIDTRNATLASSLLTATASGSANLARRTLDFRVVPKVATPFKSLGIRQLKGIPEITVPILVRGTFSSPEFVPDLQGTVQGTLREEVQKLYRQGGAKTLERVGKDLLGGPRF